MKGLLAAAALLLASSSAHGQTIFQDGFESGNASAWSFSKADGGVSYPASGCHSGSGCGALTIVGGRDQQTVMWGRTFTRSGTLYASAWWRFPQGFTWDPGGQPWGLEHKMLIVNTANSVGRVLVNLRGGGLSPELAVHFERLDPYMPEGPGVSVRGPMRWPADGAWHRLEVEIERTGGTRDHVGVWLDGAPAIDVRGRTCGSPCSPVSDMWVGAFSNQGAPRTQTFYVDDVLIAGSRAAAPQQPAGPDVNAALQAIERAAQELEQAANALGR